MLANSQGKGRALDEKSEAVLLEHNMPPDQKEKQTEDAFPWLGSHKDQYRT